MHAYTDSRLTMLVLGMFFLIVFAYGGYEARGMVMGPRVSVTSQTASVHDPLVTIQGRAERINSLTLNGTAVSVTEDGAFDQQYLLLPGENNLTLEARDVYGRTTEKLLSFTYQPLIIAATSTSLAVATSSTSSPVIVSMRSTTSHATSSSSTDSTSSPQVVTRLP